MLGLVRPGVRAMEGYVPGEQVSDAVKLNTNEGAAPPSPRVLEVLAAIADGTFGLMKRPADRGRGLDGVARKAEGPEGYANPAIDLLEGS